MKAGGSSKSLFLKQAQDHAQTLGKLLQARQQQKIDGRFMEKCIVGTKMLANSASLMGLDGWRECLAAFESLLMKYRNSGQTWDERLAQITSEIIETEEALLQAWASGDSSTLTSKRQEETRALIEEINTLLDMDFPQRVIEDERPPSEEPAEERFDEGLEQTEDKKESEIEAEPVAPEKDLRTRDSSKEKSPHGDSGEITTGGKLSSSSVMVFKLEHACKRLIKSWDMLRTSVYEEEKEALAKINRESVFANFYVSAFPLVAGLERGMENGEVILCPLDPLKNVFEDLARMLSGKEGRLIDIDLLEERTLIDARLLHKVAVILNSIIRDICMRCSDKYLRIEVEVTEKDGALLWKVRDNGDNFITDSRLDREDFLAFYPGLRVVKRELEECRGILWVEPDEDHDTRFAFTTPIHAENGFFRVWNLGEIKFAVPASEICQVMKREGLRIESDGRAESVKADGKWIPIVKPTLIFLEATQDWDMILELGFLEKRMAIYVKGKGATIEGKWMEESKEDLHGICLATAWIDKSRVPVLEAEELQMLYFKLIGSTEDNDISGGVVVNDESLSQTQANLEKELSAPPERRKSGRDVEVIVLEKSKALRSAFENIFLKEKIKFKLFEQLEKAKKEIEKSSPRLIISEFRTPSMAAKKVLEFLHRKKIEVPVLVTTSQEGEKAATLVRALGAAGYVKKPLEGKEVIESLAPFIGKIAGDVSER